MAWVRRACNAGTVEDAMLLEEMTTVETAKAISDRLPLIIPFGALEAHGKHLPLGTDAMQAYDTARRAAELAPAMVAPPIPYGICRSAAGHPGTVSLRGATLRALVKDLLASFYGTGVRRFLLYTGHASPAQIGAMEEAGLESLELFNDMCVAVVSEHDLIARFAKGVWETPGDIHAGEIETSRMLVIRADLVRMDQLPEPEMRKSTRPMLVRDARRYWPGTVEGAPRLATRSKGEALTAIAAEQLAMIVKQLADFEAH